MRSLRSKPHRLVILLLFIVILMPQSAFSGSNVAKQIYFRLVCIDSLTQTLPSMKIYYGSLMWINAAARG